MGGSPNAISVSPSKYFLGDDGSWATFQISVGTPPQSQLVYPSTLIPVTWVIPTQGCTINDNSNCAQLRNGGGQLFNVNQSTSWKDAGNFYLAVESSLGYNAKDQGDFGYDSLSIAASQGAVSVQGAAIAAIDTTDSYVGQLGLAGRNVTIGNKTSSSLLALLRDSNQIPSTSYSYTAGAYYNNSQLGSLTLGGYDASRSQPNAVSFDFGADPINYLNIGVQSISFTNSGKSQNLLSDAVAANIDSTVSAFWLPNDTCNAIANAYGLTFNPLNQLYTINSSSHASNLKNDPQLSLQISNTVAGSGSSVSINFPYAAFGEMNFTNPNENSASSIQIFPLRQATDPGQYTLGRTFLQEAVLTVDFDRQNFSLAQAIPVSSGTQPQIVNINAPGSGGGPSTSNPSSPSSTSITTVAAPSSFSSGAIAGTVVGVVGAIALGIAAFLLWRRRHRRSARGPIIGNNTETSAMPSQKLLPPELAQGQDPDYFTSKPAPPYVQTNEVTSELDSPKLQDTRFTSSQQNPTPVIATEHAPAELPGKDPAASELNSRTVSFNSSVGPFAGFTSAGPSHSPNSHLIELSPDPNRTSSLTAATGAEGSWNQTHLEPGSPASPASTRSVSMQKAGVAHIVNHKKNASSSPTFHSSHSSIDQNGMSATMINNWNEPGLGFTVDDTRRQNMHRNSRGSQSTLVGGVSGRASPETGLPPNNTTPSAFQSPEMMPIQRPDPPPTNMLQGPQSEVESPDEIDEALRRG